MKNNLENYYLQKEIQYFSNVRFDVISLISCVDGNILELGCGSGATLVELKKRKIAKYIAGIDIIDMNQKALLDKFILANVDTDEIDLPHDFFDVIICADVLEHLQDPWTVVKKLRYYLKNDGYIIASIPNIREIRTLKKLFSKEIFNIKIEVF